MKVSEALTGVLRVFLDSAPVIYHVERHPLYGSVVNEIFDRLDNGQIVAVTSPITLAECLVMPYRLAQEHVRRDFTDLIVNGSGVEFLPLDDSIANCAADLRARYKLTLTDAFQMAAAIMSTCDAFLTNDADLKRVTDLPVLVLDDLEL